MNSFLLIGLESLIDHIGSIRDLGIVYWKKANKKMQIGDIVGLGISNKNSDPFAKLYCLVHNTFVSNVKGLKSADYNPQLKSLVLHIWDLRLQPEWLI